ncbi:MAG TPA: EVE domain-containing protein [Rubellimicrobium sp.]|nr:EVE domain-containing protein [Rubellimicrobium sp.]
MAYWLFKSEPDVFGWNDQVALGEAGGEWHGVRNYQARNHMRTMQPGDLGFFYHSQKGREVVGIVEVTAPCHPDSTSDDPRWDCVDVRALRPFARPVTLNAIRAEPALADMVLVKNSRLSVQPVSPEEWHRVCALGGTEP